MNQYEIEFKEKESFEDYYLDQSMKSARYGDRIIGSAYTPYGIKCIDSQYSSLILNLNLEVKQIYNIDRRPIKGCHIKTKKEYESFYDTFYDPIDIDGKGYTGYGLKIEWVNGRTKEFFYGNRPKFDINTRKTDPIQLRQEIIDNPHLHVKIKENLLSNLETFSKNEY